MEKSINKVNIKPRKIFPGLLGAIGLIALLLLIQLIGAFIISYIPKNGQIAFLLLIQTISLVVPISLGIKISKRNIKEIIPFKRVKASTTLISIVAIFAIDIICVNAASFLPASWLDTSAADFIDSTSIVFILLIFVIVAPIMEELLYRGVILSGFQKRYHIWPAIILVSVLFGLSHLNIPQFFTTTIIGIFLAWLVYHTNSLRASMACHVFNNLWLIATAKYLPILAIYISKLWISLIFLVIGSIAIFLLAEQFKRKPIL